MDKLKVLATLAGTLCMLVGCSQPDNSQANVALVEQYLQAVDNNDYELMASLLADDYLGLGPSIDDSTNKEQALANWKWNSENLYEEVDFERTQTFATTIEEGQYAGEWAYNWAYANIKYKDGSGPVELMLNAVYKIEDGKIARTRTFYNEADVWEQLGYRIFPPLESPETE
jgi:ketosteroid isomerase-like protein